MALTWQRNGAIAGGTGARLRATDWYNTSETNYTVLYQETYMCQISTRNGLRNIATISASPDPDAVFSKWFTEPLVGPSVLGNGAAASNKLYFSDEVWVTIDQSKLPLTVGSFSADRKTAVVTSSLIGSFAEASFQAPDPADPTKTIPVLIYPLTFYRVALYPNPYGVIVGAIATYSEPRQCRDRVSAVAVTVFPKDYLGRLPNTVYLRMQVKVVKDGKETFVDYVPANPIRGSPEAPATNEFGLVRFEIDDLDLNSTYTIAIIDITDNPYDSSTIRERKQNLKTLIADPKYFAFIRSLNPGESHVHHDELADSSMPADLDLNNPNQSIYFYNANILDQTPKLTTFQTPPSPRDTCTPITFIAGSCFAGTLDAFEGAYKVPHMFSVLDGDIYYNDNSDGSIKDFIANYMGWLKNVNGQRTITSSGVYTLRDDHEVADNWYRLIAISRFNVARYLLDNGVPTGPENTLYNKILSIPQTAARIPFRRTNQFQSSLASSERIKNAFDAYNMFWPAVPYKIDPKDMSSNGCFRVRWGNMNMILLNSNADLNADLSVTYHAVEGTLSADQQSFTRPPVESYNYIPPESVKFLKKILKEKDAGFNAVFFSSDVGLLFNNRYEFLREQFKKTAIAAIRSTDPSAPIPYPVIESLYEKLFNAFNYDNPDGYHEQIDQLIKWIKKNNVYNVAFFTGDPHSSLVRYLDEENVILSACLSSVSTYRASGANLLTASNLDSNETLVSLSNNSYGALEYDPNTATLDIKLRYADEVRATATIKLKKRRGWF